MMILDKCKQIIDTESGRVLLYRDEVEAVLAETQKRKQRKGRDARGAFVTGDWHLEVTGAEFGNDGALNRVDIEGMDYKSGWFHQELVKIESQPEVLTAGDTISRRQAIAEFSCCELTPDGGIDANYAVDFLEQLPSAQSEIVHCKDCKHYDGRPCGIVEWYNTADDFCSKAERREE